jgi:hypothetical protein
MPSQTMTETREGRRNRILNQRADEESRKALARLLDDLHERARKAKQLRDLGATSTAEKAKHAADNPDESQLKGHEKVQAKLFLCVYPAAWLFEFLLLGALAEFLMSLGLYDMPWGVILLGRFLVPTAVLVADAYVGAQLVAAREDAFERQENVGKYLWMALCIGWVLLLASLAGYTCYVKLATEAAFSWGDVWLPLILAAFSLFFHCAIVFAGERLRNAKAFLSYMRAQAKLDRAVKTSAIGYEQERAAVSQTYRDYTDALDLHNTQHPHAQVGAGPFDKDVVTTVNEIFGPVILPPPVGQANPESGAVAGSVRPPANGSSTNGANPTMPDPANPFRAPEGHRDSGNGHDGSPFDSFHLDVDGRIRDAESEVTA